VLRGGVKQLAGKLMVLVLVLVLVLVHETWRTSSLLGYWLAGATIRSGVQANPQRRLAGQGAQETV
jgi:hypothetical protein